ncbi:hypothetical protein BDR22DRAFT_893789 [Usnea florida]
MLQDTSLPFIKYPLVLGQDVAGTVEDVGSTATSNFKVGDRVFGFSINNGFKGYVTLDRGLAAKVPDSLFFNDASVIPLCVSTSSLALFGKEYLALPFPTLNPTTKAAGFQVITTCSPRSFDYVKNLGASKVFDYNSPSVTDDIAAELDKGTYAGVCLAAGKVTEACQVSHKSKQKLFVASSNPVMPGDALEGVEAKMTFGTGGADVFKEILPITFGGFLVEGLAKGVYKVAPSPEVVPAKGLEGI